MEITPDGARVLASILPVGLLIIAVHTRGMRRRIRIVPKTFALWATIVIIVAVIAAIALCVWCTNTGEVLTDAPAWFVVIAATLLALQTAATFYEFVALSMREEEA